MAMAIAGGLWFLLLAAQPGPSRDEALRAMRRAADFYANKVAIGGGYHYYYTADLSFGRSEHAEGPTQIEFQRDATPAVAMTFLEAFDATGDPFYLEAARKAGQAYLRGQLCSGGWDYLVEFDPAKRQSYRYRVDNNCGEDKRGVTNLDDNVTQSAVRFLMRLDRAGGFRDSAVHEAVEFALAQLLAAQYPIGAWPQRFDKIPDRSLFPVKQASYPETWSREWPGPDYQKHYTLNDNTLADAIDTMLEAARVYRDPRYLESAERGGRFLLLAQMPDPQPAWAAQYDSNMHPAWARVFEPPSVTGGESEGAARILMTLYRETGNRKFLEPIPRALDYLKRSILPPAARPVEARARVQGPVLARFYELRTNRPLYITKGSRLAAAGLGSRMVDGYRLSYADDSVITHYGVLVSGAWLEDVEGEYRGLIERKADELRRPERLSGLSPWMQRDRSARPRAELASIVRETIAGMDPRGAWLSEGTIGKADRLVFLYAAKDMVLRISRGAADGAARPGADAAQTVALRENDTVEVFQGAQPPKETIVDSRVFVRNMGLLLDYIRRAD